MPRGGKRPGAGRKPAVNMEDAQKAANEALARTGKTLPVDASPLDLLLHVMRDPEVPLPTRIDCAKAAARFVHPALSNVESKVTVEKRDAIDWSREELVAILNEGRKRAAAGGNGTAAPGHGDDGSDSVH